MALIERFFPPVSEELPCGLFVDDDDDMESDFMALESAYRGKQAVFVDADNNKEAEPADWDDVLARAKALSENTKDVRILVYMIKSLIHVKGFLGFAEGVQLLTMTLATYWQSVHPVLDDSSDDNPWRIMCMNELGGEDVQQALHTQPLVQSRVAGSFDLRTIKIAQGKIVPLEGSEEQVHDMALVAGAFQDADNNSLQENHSAVVNALEQLSEMENQLQQSDCSHALLSWKQLKNNLNDIKAIYAEYGVAGTVEDAIEISDETSTDEVDTLAGAVVRQAAVTVADANINNRNDVINALEKICQYYETHEPSSPLPLLINRAKRLATMDFMSILRDISPDGLNQAQLLAGSSEDD